MDSGSRSLQEWEVKYLQEWGVKYLQVLKM